MQWANQIKDSIVTVGSHFGWHIMNKSISIVNDRFITSMVVSCNIIDLSSRSNSSTWKTNLTLIKSLYPTHSQTDKKFAFSSPTKPPLLAPEEIHIELPETAINIQFDPAHYLLSYQLANRTGCVIASAAYGSEMAPEVVYMRYVRDNMIGSNEVGKAIIIGWNSFYYSWSPPIAEAATNWKILGLAFRILLLPLVGVIHLTAFSYVGLASLNTALASSIAFPVVALCSVTLYFGCPALACWMVYKRIRK
jgi:hypothetical protein